MTQDDPWTPPASNVPVRGSDSTVGLHRHGPLAAYPETPKAKFHYAILVADRFEAGRRPVAELLARAR